MMPAHPEEARSERLDLVRRMYAARDLSALISSAGLAVPVETILGWDAEQQAEAERWARRAKAWLASRSPVGPTPTPPPFFPM